VAGRPLPIAASADGSTITAIHPLQDDRSITLVVYSTAMNADIPVDVERAANTSVPRPVLYLLNGAGGGEDTATWQRNTDASRFFADKNINVVQPVGGRSSYYTDWRAPDPVLGVNKWRTFLTEELPPVIDAALGTNGMRAIAGVSMSETSVLQLPIAKPGLYRAVAAYSGCAQISDPVGYEFARLVVAANGGDPANMYGPEGDPMWAANDPYLHADKLRGTQLFISDGTGLPGRHDTTTDPHRLPLVDGGLAEQLIVGGIIEAAVNWCTHNLKTKLHTLGIPATFDLRPTGTHSWGYWEDDLKASWPVLAKGLGLPPE
jgi:S-formylglutathione hydrolase FrmB